MKRLIYLLMCVLFLIVLPGCNVTLTADTAADAEPTITLADETGDESATETAARSEKTSDIEFDKCDVSDAALEAALKVITENGVYTTPATVAAYLHTFGKLPQNFITKREAQELGWDSHDGNLADVAPGMSIGGDRFGNYEKRLENGNYRECDVNYDHGRRDAERIIYNTDGDIYYTDDHYNTFTQLF